MGATDIGAKLRSAALAAIDKHSFGDDFGFDAAPMLGPTPAGGAMVIYTLIVTMKSPLLGQGPLVNITQLQSPHPSSDQVEQAVVQAMDGLRKLSRDLLAAPGAPSVEPLR